MQKLTYWEQEEIERLSKKEADEPEFVTREKERMIKLIKEGKSDEIVYGEWGEAYSPVDPDTEGERCLSATWSGASLLRALLWRALRLAAVACLSLCRALREPG